MLPVVLPVFEEVRSTIAVAHLEARCIWGDICERGARPEAEHVHWI